MQGIQNGDGIGPPKVDLFRLLGDEDRLRLLALCREEELTVGELATLLGESQPQVSKKSQPLRDAGICDSLSDVDFLEIHAFGCQPKSPNPLVDPTGYAQEVDRLRKAYARAYGGYFREHCPDNGLPCRFTVHVVDVPDQVASYEFYGTALLQR